MKKYQKKFNEYAEKQYIIGISLDSNSKKMCIVGFKKEYNAEYAKDFFETFTDISVFAVDYYGYSSFDQAEEYFSKNRYDVIDRFEKADIAIQSNPRNFANKVYKSLK